MLRRHCTAIVFVAVCAAWAGLVLQAQATTQARPDPVPAAAPAR